MSTPTIRRRPDRRIPALVAATAIVLLAEVELA